MSKHNSDDYKLLTIKYYFTPGTINQIKNIYFPIQNYK